jgi:uroporphyrinogen decarboxylase
MVGPVARDGGGRWRTVAQARVDVRRATISGVTTPAPGSPSRVTTLTPPPQPGPATAHPGLTDSAFLKACRREPVPHTPVWFMRQAGRSLPEYRRVREGIAMLDACRTPELVAEITMQPVRRHGVDAAILFSDIVVPLKAIGVDLDIVPGVGPVIARPIRSAADLDQLRPLDVTDVGFITEAIGQLTAELGPTPLIGFAGAPFTLASYLVEGGPSRNHENTKALMYGAPDIWDELMRRLAGIQATWLRIQVAAGASAIQLFDSWVGALPAADYLAHVLPHSRAVLAALEDTGVPRIHFGVGTGELLALMGQAGADVVGVDFRVPLDEATRRVGPDRALQGNLDPALLFAPWEAVAAHTRSILEAGRAAPGHIFNLGHGVIPETDPDVLARVVDLVHEASAV